MKTSVTMATAVEVTDFLISVMTALNDEVMAHFDTDLREHSFKVQLQNGLKGHASEIVKQAHEFAQEVVSFVRQQCNDQDKKVVLLVDSVEQIRGVGSDADDIYRSVENLFLGHTDNLKIPMLHMLYTIPPYMSALTPGFGCVLGGNPVQTLPSIHVRNIINQDDALGLQLMFDILKKRCEDVENTLKLEQINQLARLSGGDIRNFFRFVRSCLSKAASSYGFPLPLADPLLVQVTNQFGREILIAEDDKEWLKKIDESGDHNLTSQQALSQFARLLDTGLVLNYRNGDNWYGVNPLLKDKLEE